MPSANAIDRLVELVKLNVGRTGDTDLDDYVLTWANDTQTEVCNKANFWFMRKQADIVLAITSSPFF